MNKTSSFVLRGLPAFAFFLLLSLFGAHAATLTKEQLAEFDAGDGKTVRTDRADAYVKHILDEHHVLAKYDKNYNGRIDPEELVKLNGYFAGLRSRNEAQGYNAFIENGLPLVLEPAPPPIREEVKPREEIAAFHLRENKTELPFASGTDEFKASNGAAFSWHEDIENDGEQTASVNAAFGFVWQKNFDVPENYQAGSLAFDGLYFGPYVDAQGQLLASESVVQLGALLGTTMIGGPFDLQRFTTAPYYQTDFEGRSEVIGATTFWQPHLASVGLGAIKSPDGGLLDYTFLAQATADYRQVHDPGETGLKRGQNYFWLGGEVTAKVWPFPDVFKKRLFASVTGRLYRDVITGHEATQFTTGAGWKLDKDGHASLNLEYTNGESYQDQETEEFIKGTLRVKF